MNKKETNEYAGILYLILCSATIISFAFMDYEIENAIFYAIVLGFFYLIVKK